VTAADISAALVALTIVIGSAHAIGQVMERLRQPRLIGEILAGVLLGPFVFGRVAPAVTRTVFGGDAADDTTRIVIEFVSWLGLLLLMFLSGSEARRVLARENRRATAWLFGLGTPLPFVAALIVGSWISLDGLAGPSGSRASVLLILAAAATVMSIPVISRIFHDLGILGTRFASLVLSVAIAEDIVLWAVLAIATALAASGAGAAGGIATHVAATVAYLFAGVAVAPALVKRLHDARWNSLATASPVRYAVLLLLVYGSLASLMNVNLVFAAFLAGFGLVGGREGASRERFAVPLEAITSVSTAVFVPVYFVVVGSQLQLGHQFAPVMLAVFLIGSTIVRAASVAGAAKLAGFAPLDRINLAVTCNARGGPGIVLASIAFEAGIINGRFFTTLVLTAILTSQFAGAWLAWVLRRGRPLLSDDHAGPERHEASASPLSGQGRGPQRTAVERRRRRQR